MATFILIHGAWHGSWCWEKTSPYLLKAGHRVIAPDLIGMIKNMPRDSENILEFWNDQITELAVSQTEPVVLVGHSRGGLIVSAVAERVPDHVAQTVYVAACMLKDGETLAEVEFATQDLLSSISMSRGGMWAEIESSRAVELMSHQCSPELASKAMARLESDVLQPVRVALHLSAERFGRVPRAYIETIDDQAVNIRTQRNMQRRWPCDLVISLHSDHSPFYSMPERLAKALNHVSTRIKPA
jgi:pimeloyl-ACP methyl ester carboxylesterase